MFRVQTGMPCCPSVNWCQAINYLYLSFGSLYPNYIRRYLYAPHYVFIWKKELSPVSTTPHYACTPHSYTLLKQTVKTLTFVKFKQPNHIYFLINLYSMRYGSNILDHLQQITDTLYSKYILCPFLITTLCFCNGCCSRLPKPNHQE